MKYIFYFLFILNMWSYGQTNNNLTDMVIATKANIRNTPSLDGEIIGSIKQGEWIDESEGDRHKDIVNEMKGHWIPIKHGGKVGFVWSHAITSNVFTSTKNKNKKKLFQLIGTQQLRYVCMVDTQTISDKILNLDWLEVDGEYVYFRPFYNLAAFPNKEVFEISWYNRSKEKQYSYVIEANDSNLVFAEAYKIESEASIYFDENQDLYRISNHTTYVDILYLTDYPDDHSDTIEIVQEDEAVIRDSKRQSIKYDGFSEEWIPVYYKDGYGFIDATFLERPSQIFDNIYDSTIKYGISDKYLYYYRNRKLLSENKIKEHITPEKIAVYPSTSLTNSDEIIKLSYYGESCGVPSGDLVYVRNGDEIVFLFHNESMGDGGYGTETSFSIIGQDSILEFSYENEYLMGNGDDKNITHDYQFNVYYQLYKWTDNTLEPLESKYDIISDLASRNDWLIDNQFYLDLNNNGREDIVGVLRKIKENEDDYLEFEDESVLVIYLQDEDGTYQLYGQNHEIYKKGFSATEIKTTESGFQLEILYAEDCIGCSTTKGEDFGYKTYDFSIIDSNFVLQQTKWINRSDFEHLDNEAYWKIIDKNNIEFMEVK